MRRMQHTNVTASWGFTLVELVVSMTVVSIIMLTIGVMFTSSYQEAFKTKGQSEADNSLQKIFGIVLVLMVLAVLILLLTGMECLLMHSLLHMVGIILYQV